MYIPQPVKKDHPQSISLPTSLRGQGQTFGIISLSILLGFFVFGALALIIHNWGWWRIKDFESRRRYIKTWHGWTNRKKWEEELGLRYQLKHGLTSMSRWEVPTSAYGNWMSWDSNGRKQKLYMKLRDNKLLRMLPRWMRSGKPGLSAPQHSLGLQHVSLGRGPNSHSQAIETSPIDNSSVRRKGFLQYRAMGQIDGPHPDVRSGRSTHPMGSAVRESPEEESTECDTVQRKRGGTSNSPAWQMNSSETSRVSLQHNLSSREAEIVGWVKADCEIHRPPSPTFSCLRMDFVPQFGPRICLYGLNQTNRTRGRRPQDHQLPKQWLRPIRTIVHSMERTPCSKGI